MNLIAFVKRILLDFEKRTLVFATLSFIINFSYALYSVFVAFFALSLWHFSLAVYYIIFAAERISVLSAYRRKDRTDFDYRKKQLRVYRRAGILMIVMHLLLSGAMAEFVFVERGFRLPGSAFYLSIIYALYKIFCAVYNVFKRRKIREVGVIALRSISLADASVSALALETVISKRLSQTSSLFLPINLVSSALVSIFTLSLGIYTVISANKAIKRA